MRRLRTCALCVALTTCAAPVGVRVGSSAQAPAGIVVRLGGSVSQAPIDGRLLLLLATDGAREPRFQVSATSLSSAQVFGVDVDGLKAGDERTFDAGVLGYPLESLRDLPAGEYTVQALLHKYETVHLASGHTLKLPMDRGEGQQWNSAPGNIHSAAQKVQWDGGRGAVIRLELDKVIPALPEPADTKYVKHTERSTSTCPGSCGETGTAASAGSSRARSISMSATWTITT